MKLITLILIIVLPFFAQSQRLSAGMMAGYSSKQSALGELYIVTPLAKKILFYPVSFKVHSKMNNPTMPVIVEERLGYKLASWELYGGYGYHFIGNENHKELDGYKGFKPCGGIIKHFGKFIASTEVSGSLVSLQVGIFGGR